MILPTLLICSIQSTPATASEAPVPLRLVERRFSVTRTSDGAVESGALERTHERTYDRRGRLQRREIRGPEGGHKLTWVAIHLDDGAAPSRAAYWSDDHAVPYLELFVSSADGRMQDVLYGDASSKPRRQMRQYLDEAGREIYQEYFAPKSQNRYGEEFFRYDDSGNLLEKEWRRLDGRARRATKYEIRRSDAFGRWTERLVYVDGGLTALDRRTIEDSDRFREVAAASAGPVEPSLEILPIPFAPGVVSTTGSSENALSFGPEGNTVLFTRYDGDYRSQEAWICLRDKGAWREPEQLPFGTLYNAALSEDGGRIVYCIRDDALGGGRAFLTEREESGWSEPIDLSQRDGLFGSYFRLLADGTLYYHRDGDLYRRQLGERDEVSVGSPINTAEGVEFSAWVDEKEDLMLFARSVDGAPERSGLFAARREDGSWGEPRRLPLPYGWSPTLSPDGEDLVYVVDDDIYRVPLSLLELP